MGECLSVLEPVCSLAGAGYGSYGYGSNSATAGYSKYEIFLSALGKLRQRSLGLS